MIRNGRFCIWIGLKRENVTKRKGRHEYTYDFLYHIPAAIEGFQPSLLAVGKSECNIRYDDDDLEI